MIRPATRTKRTHTLFHDTTLFLLINTIEFEIGLAHLVLMCALSFLLGPAILFVLRPVEIHREFMTAAARWTMALKLWSVLSARMAIRLNSLSLQKKFSIR